MSKNISRLERTGLSVVSALVVTILSGCASFKRDYQLSPEGQGLVNAVGNGVDAVVNGVTERLRRKEPAGQLITPIPGVEEIGFQEAVDEFQIATLEEELLVKEEEAPLSSSIFKEEE